MLERHILVHAQNPLSRLVRLAGLLALGLLFASPAHTSQVVTLDHLTLVVTPSGSIGLRDGDTLLLHVTNTSRNCYTFNLKSVKDETATELQAKNEQVKFDDTVEIPITHREGIGAYEVEIRRRPGQEADICIRSEHTFRIEVDTYGWSLSFAGAFTYDELTNPVYFLEDGVRNPNDPVDEQEIGFFVRDSPGKEDSHNLGLAAVVHLYHSDSERFRIGRKKSHVNWAPLSFGLGVTEQSASQYYIGTTFRFGLKTFLTVGAAFGSRERLPNNLSVGSFTMESNALTSLPTQKDSALFLGVSYGFLGTGAAPFKKGFESLKPTPKADVTPQAKPAAGNAAEESRLLQELNKSDAIAAVNALFETTTNRFCSVTLADRANSGDWAATVEVKVATLKDPQLPNNAKDAKEWKRVMDEVERKVKTLQAKVKQVIVTTCQ